MLQGFCASISISHRALSASVNLSSGGLMKQAMTLRTVLMMALVVVVVVSVFWANPM
jgi:hypothetical protein